LVAQAAVFQAFAVGKFDRNIIGRSTKGSSVTRA
jgi:hypothetical protein